jgi:hypothetical protein
LTRKPAANGPRGLARPWPGPRPGPLSSPRGAANCGHGGHRTAARPCQLCRRQDGQPGAARRRGVVGSSISKSWERGHSPEPVGRGGTPGGDGSGAGGGALAVGCGGCLHGRVWGRITHGSDEEDWKETTRSEGLPVSRGEEQSGANGAPAVGKK